MSPQRYLNLRIPLPNGGWLRRLLPTPGNVLFTLVMIALLVAAQTAGALPLGRPPGIAPTAASTGTIAYQGRLADADGNPLTGTYNMIFRLYDAATGGTPLWSEQWTGSNGVRVSDGLFNVMLGSLTPLPISQFTNYPSLFLGITVGTDDEMAPRVQLGSVPFAVQALTVPDGSITTAKLADHSVTREKLGVALLTLLGHDTCYGCPTVTENNLIGWQTVKGTSPTDAIEVTVTTRGGPVRVEMTAGFETAPGIAHFCGIAVMQSGAQKMFVHLDGDRTPVSDSDCSGTWLFTDLPAGTYTFVAEGHMGGAVPTVNWIRERQIAVYEFQLP